MNSDKDELVILLHGLGRTALSMALLGRALRKDHFKTINYGYSSRAKTIEEHARQLHTFLKGRVSPSTTLHFVTHSLGSIVTRSFAAQFQNSYTFGRAVMLGPPHQGSVTAANLQPIGWIRSLMGPSFVQLANKELPPQATDILEIGVIAGQAGNKRGAFAKFLEPHDGIVSLSETRLGGVKDSLIVQGLHSFLMYKPEVVRQAVRFLRTGTFDHPEQVCDE